jgi:hypothetical protein
MGTGVGVGDISVRVKLDRETEYSPQSSVKVKKGRVIPPYPRVHGVVLD